MRRPLRGVAVLLASAGVLLAVYLLTSGYLFFLPVGLFYQVIGSSVQAFLVALVVLYVVVPLGVVLAYRWPWWVRWAAGGLLSSNTVLLTLFFWRDVFTTP